MMGIASTAGGWLEWDGSLDELAVYAGALTSDEVARHPPDRGGYVNDAT